MIGRKVKIAGIECTISSEEECAKAELCIAMPIAMHRAHVADGGYEIPGTKGGFFCRVCGGEVVLAPSGQRLDALGAKWTCFDCARKFMEGQKGGTQ